MVEFDILFSESFLIEAFKRYWRTRLWGRLWWGAKVVLGLLLIVATLLSFFFEVLPVSLIFGALGGVLLLSRPIDLWIFRRRFRKSPYKDDRFHFTFCSEGFLVKGGKSEVRADWVVFTSARRFHDGFLLFQGPGVFNWLPFEKIVAGSVAEFDQLIGVKIGDVKNA